MVDYKAGKNNQDMVFYNKDIYNNRGSTLWFAVPVYLIAPAILVFVVVCP